MAIFSAQLHLHRTTPNDAPPRSCRPHAPAALLQAFRPCAVPSRPMPYFAPSPPPLKFC
ncbi:MAG: hypothetical protein IKG81_08080 [Bacteroidales bacterium]|nr:hypothetical protein [Bacteroidales bacterium]